MKCPHCGKRGLKGAQGVAMHIGRIHKNTITPPGTRPGPRQRPVVLEDHADHEHAGNGGLAVAQKANVTLRRTTRVTTDEAVLTPKFAVNGCPNCLQPLAPMNESYAKLNITPPPFCPFCTCPVGMVRTALRVQQKQIDAVTA